MASPKEPGPESSSPYDLYYDDAGILRLPATCDTLAETALAEHLHQARTLLETRPDGGPGLPARFEALRWFPLPPSCVTPTVQLSELTR